MNVDSLKNQLHQFIDSTDDEQLLSELYKRIILQAEDTDWWNALSEAQKTRILQSRQQYHKGEVVSNEVVLQKIQ